MWKGVQPGPSNMCQIKWDVSVYNLDNLGLDTVTVKNRQTDRFISNIYLIFPYKPMLLSNIKI